MERRYPLSMAYLRSWEERLRAREGGKFNGDEWYRFGRNQNIDKQDLPKLVVPRLVEHLRASFDPAGALCLDNVDVGGVLPAQDVHPEFLVGVLNSEVVDFVFRLISKPFQGDYRSANRQFIAPLPVPDASPKDRADVAARARELQRLWTDRRDLLVEAGERLSVLARAKHPAKWLWPDLPTIKGLTEQAPKALRHDHERHDWAKTQLEELEAARRDALQARLDACEDLAARFESGELKLFSGGRPILSRIYLDDDAGRLAEAYWRFLILSRDEWRDAGKFQAALRSPPSPTASAAANQFLSKVDDLAATMREIARNEDEMNEKLYALYGLTPDERELVENARN